MWREPSLRSSRVPHTTKAPARWRERGLSVDVKGLERKMGGSGQECPFTSTRAHMGPDLH